MRTVCGEEGVEGLREDVDDAGEALAAPVPCAHGGKDGAAIVEVRDSGRVEELSEEDDVVEGDRHAAAGEGVAHVERIAEHDEPGRHVCAGRQEAVGHAAQLALV